MHHRTEREIMKNWKGDEDKPIVSVCCAAYNHEKFISDAIDGFLMQETDFSFEIIIRDDASMDNTAKIIEKYEKKFPKLIKPIYEKENTFSKGIKPMADMFKVAKGRYLAICEGDDYWIDTKKLQVQKDFLDNNQEYVICYTDCQPFDATGLLDIDFGGARRDLTSEELQKGTSIFTLTTMFRNEFNIPPEYSFAKYGDKFIWSILGEFGKGKFLSQVLPSRYRVHSGGIHSMQLDSTKVIMDLQTYMALYIYHKRLKHNVATYYAVKIVTFIFKFENVDLIVEIFLLLKMKLLRKVVNFIVK